MTSTQTLTDADRADLDRLVAECEAAARAEGWTGPWTLQVGDVDSIILARRGTLRDARLTAAEGEYLGINRCYGVHVDWDEDKQHQYWWDDDGCWVQIGAVTLGPFSTEADADAAAEEAGS